MHIHILGICGTFMGSVARLAQELGHRVTGSDAQVYPPMSVQLEQAGITVTEGYDPRQLIPAPDLVIVGNALSRGNPCVEYLLDHSLNYTSGPQWLGQTILANRHVLAVSGTHGKTTTSSMLTAVLMGAGLRPGYLIGGVPIETGVSASLGDGKYFVVEADEYDSAFFDKRSKFLHYHSNTLLINNIEFDHADIFDNIASIEKQFHHLMRSLPSRGVVIYPDSDASIESVMAAGCWSRALRYGEREDHWHYRLLTEDGSCFDVVAPEWLNEVQHGRVTWALSGLHNVRNAMAAILAAWDVGVPIAQSCEILSRFAGVKRRMEVLYRREGLTVYDDFAHHPTAIASTLAGLRKKVGDRPIIAVIEPRSATMRLGIHEETLAQSVAAADRVLWYRPARLNWNIDAMMACSNVISEVFVSIEPLIDRCLALGQPETHIVIMSNGGFDGLYAKLLARLEP